MVIVQTKKLEKSEPMEIETPDDREKNFLNLNSNLKSVLKKNNSKVMLTFKDMNLLIMKTDGKKTKVLLDKKYKMGDIGKMNYVRELKSFIQQGYEVIERTDNIDELLKEQRKRKKEEVPVDTTVDV